MTTEATYTLQLSAKERKIIEQALTLKFLQLEGDIQALDPEFADLKHELEVEFKLVKSLQKRLQYAVGY